MVVEFGCKSDTTENSYHFFIVLYSTSVDRPQPMLWLQFCLNCVLLILSYFCNCLLVTALRDVPAIVPVAVAAT